MKPRETNPTRAGLGRLTGGNACFPLLLLATVCVTSAVQTGLAQTRVNALARRALVLNSRGAAMRPPAQAVFSPSGAAQGRASSRYTIAAVNVTAAAGSLGNAGDGGRAGGITAVTVPAKMIGRQTVARGFFNPGGVSSP